MHKLQLTGQREVLPENWDILKPLHAICRVVGLCDSFLRRINFSAFLLAINVRMTTSVKYATRDSTCTRTHDNVAYSHYKSTFHIQPQHAPVHAFLHCAKGLPAITLHVLLFSGTSNFLNEESKCSALVHDC